MSNTVIILGTLEVRTVGESVAVRVGPAEVFLSTAQTGHLISLLKGARGRASCVHAHNDNIARGAKSPWTEHDVRDLTHEDLEAIVAADQAGSWREG